MKSGVRGGQRGMEGKQAAALWAELTQVVRFQSVEGKEVSVGLRSTGREPERLPLPCDRQRSYIR